jgi:hypothetical protein
MLVGCLSAQCLHPKQFFYALWGIIKQVVSTEGYATTEQLGHATRAAFQNITRRHLAQHDGAHTQVHVNYSLRMKLFTISVPSAN